MKTNNSNSKKVDFDEFVGEYDDLLREKTAFFTANDLYFAKHTINVCSSLVKNRPKRILEFGCGNGRNLPFLKEKFSDAEIFGSDVTVGVLDFAKSSNPTVNFFLENDYEYENIKFDLILAVGVIHHIKDAERIKVFHKLFNRLNPGGSFIVVEHNPFNFVTRNIVRSCPYDADAELITPKRLKSLLSLAGFEKFLVGFYLFIPPALKRFLFLESYFKNLPIGGKYYLKCERRL